MSAGELHVNLSLDVHVPCPRVIYTSHLRGMDGTVSTDAHGHRPLA